MMAGEFTPAGINAFLLTLICLIWSGSLSIPNPTAMHLDNDAAQKR